MENEKLANEIDKFYENYQGAEDTRSEEEKADDIHQEEFVAEANPISWVEKKPQDWRVFPILNQFYTSKCVAFTTAKLALINFWLKTKEFLLFSPNSIYDYRVNKPSGGMVGNNAFEIWEEHGISLESVCKSNQIQETEQIEITNFAKEVAKGFKLGDSVTIANGDFDRVISTIQTTGKGVMVWFWFTSAEWSPEIPVLNPNTSPSNASRHSVTAVDGGLINGIQYMRIEDSAHFGGRNIRYITREFFNARNFFIKYPMNFNYEEGQLPEETPKLTKTLKFGMTDTEVKLLQEILKAKGFFPSNINTTEYFGNVTKKSTISFQKANNLVGDGIVGPITRELLNK